MFNTAESILIVEASDTGSFSKLLYNMIGNKDDNAEEVVGPVDGSIDASLFNEDQFAQTPLSSSQKVIFIGWPEGAYDYIQAIRFENHDAVDEDGVYLGVSGNHACITVNTEPPTKEGYWEFLERAREHGQEFDDLLADLRSGEDSNGEEPKDPNPLFGIAKAVAKAAADGASNVNQAITIQKKAPEIREQRYQYAIKRFYMEMLKDFAEA